MKTYKYFAGFSVIAGGVLSLTRMLPAMAGVDQMPEFPLEKAEALAAFVAPNFSGHLISHLMALTAFILLIIGIQFLYTCFKDHGFQVRSGLLLIVGIGGFLLFFIAAVFDGLIVPMTIRKYTENVEVLSSAQIVELAHYTAISFFAIALLLIFIAIGLISQMGLHSMIFSRWLCWMGLIVGYGAAAAYILGRFGYHWESPVGGLFIMVSNLWWIILGVYILRIQPKLETHPAQ